jgi:hypothetical protein
MNHYEKSGNAPAEFVEKGLPLVKIIVHHSLNRRDVQV